MLEPSPGSTDEEVMQELTACGATDISLLAPGFISARIPRDKFTILKKIAHVHEKPLHEPHKPKTTT